MFECNRSTLYYSWHRWKPLSYIERNKCYLIEFYNLTFLSKTDFFVNKIWFASQLTAELFWKINKQKSYIKKNQNQFERQRNFLTNPMQAHISISAFNNQIKIGLPFCVVFPCGIVPKRHTHTHRFMGGTACENKINMPILDMEFCQQACVHGDGCIIFLSMI